MRTVTSAAAPLALSDVDLADLDLFEHGTLGGRSTSCAPPTRCTGTRGRPQSGFWSLTRYHDIVGVARHRDVLQRAGRQPRGARRRGIEARRSMLETDGDAAPRPAALLRASSRRGRSRGTRRSCAGSPRPPSMRRFAKGEFDFVKEVAADFPIRVLARMLDVPDKDIYKLIDWGNRMVGNTDPEHADVLAHSDESEAYRLLPFRSPAALEVFEYGHELADERRGNDGTDLVSRLVNQTPEDGVPLSQRDFNSYFLLLVVAGNETTRHTITHSMRYLIENPDQMRLLQERPELIPWASRSSCGWRARCTTSAAPRPATPRSAGRRSTRATRSSRGSPRATATPRSSPTRTGWMSRAPERAHDVRPRRPAHVPGQRARAARDPDHVRDAAAAVGGHQRDRRGRHLRSNFVNGIKELPVTVTLA